MLYAYISLQKNLPKVTAPGKLIYIDDGRFIFKTSVELFSSFKLTRYPLLTRLVY
jgi:hypothetical protein